MLRFACKNMAVKKAKLLLVTLSIVLSASVALLAYNVSRQVEDGIVDTAGFYDVIIGPSGSATQLAMNTMFFTDSPLGTVPYSLVEELEANPDVNEAVPFTMGDSFNAAKIVGVTPAYLAGKTLREGEMYSDAFTCVVGTSVASKYGLSLGSELVTSHGLSEHGAAHAATPLTVTGILAETHTAFDGAIFTSCETVWAVHDHEHEEEEDEEEGETHAEENEVCAVLVRTKSFSAYYALTEYYAKDSSLLVINPATVLREVLENVDLSTQIVYVLCAIILVMNIFVISVITLLNMIDARPEIALMRLIGVSMRSVSLLYLMQNGLAGLLATALSFAASRLCLAAMSEWVMSMGIALNPAAVYPLEWAIMALVFVISVLPTLLCVRSMARKDSLGGNV